MEKRLKLGLSAWAGVVGVFVSYAGIRAFAERDQGLVSRFVKSDKTGRFNPSPGDLFSPVADHVEADARWQVWTPRDHPAVQESFHELRLTR
jgi:hypothetical protein